MRPKGKLFALVAVFAAIGVVVATGAFTTVSADRTAEVNVAGDSAALLGLAPADTDNGDTYADNSSDELQLQNLGEVNPDAVTEINDVFVVTNNGNQDVELTIDKAGNNTDAVTFYDGAVGSGTEIGDTSGVTLTTGESITVSMEIDTDTGDLSADTELLDSITINANATAT